MEESQGPTVTINIPRYSHYNDEMPLLEHRSRVIVDAELETHVIDDVMEEYSGQLHVQAFKDGREKQFEAIFFYRLMVIFRYTEGLTNTAFWVVFCRQQSPEMSQMDRIYPDYRS